MPFDPTQLHHTLTGPAEGLVVNVGPAVNRQVTLRGEFPEHWEHAILEAIWIPGGATGASLDLSTDGLCAQACFLPPNKPFRFLAKGREWARVTYSGTATTDRVILRVASDITALPDNWGFQSVFGKRPDTYLHADLLPGTLGGATLQSAVGLQRNATQAAAPVVANSWLGRRALDFSGNKALRFDSLAPLLPNVSGPITAVLAVILPNTSSARALFDFQSTALPASRYFDFYTDIGDMPTLYTQGASGVVSVSGPVLTAAQQDVPLLLGVTKHAATWDVCVLTAAGAVDVVAGAAHSGSGAATFDLMTLGAEFDGTTFGVHANFQLRAFAMWTGIDIPIATLRRGLQHFRDALDCPLS